MKGENGYLGKLEQEQRIFISSNTAFTTYEIVKYLILADGKLNILTGYNFHIEVPKILGNHEDLQNKIMRKQLKIENLDQICEVHQKWKSIR